MSNILNRFVPKDYKSFGGIKKKYDKSSRKLIKEVFSFNEEKLVNSFGDIFDKLEIKDGMTLSFHHHLRNGDYVLNMVLEEIKKRNLKNITLAPSAIFPVHEKMVDLIKNENIIKLYTNYINGEVAKAVSKGYLKELLIMHTHGGRARAIEAGELSIDVAFIAVPTCDSFGNGNGVYGKSACGSLGYIIPDMMYAKKKVVVTDNLVENIDYIEIEGKYIDYILKVDAIGDPKGIVSGTTQVTTNPIGLKIAKDTAKLLNELGAIKDNFSFQTGAGGTSLAVADEIKKIMKKENISASFASGGITSYLVNMLEDNLLNELYDVQCFDLAAVKSYEKNKNHIGMSSSKYGNPYHESVVVNDLDIVILGATEIDTNFNVNVTTDSNNQLIGGSGGHSDTAYGANITIITTPLIKSRIPIIRDSINTITTPGETVDIIVTERGIAINPNRLDLLNKVRDSKLNIMSIDELKQIAYSYTGKPKILNYSQDVVGLVEYRDGTIIDSIYRTK